MFLVLLLRMVVLLEETLTKRDLHEEKKNKKKSFSLFKDEFRCLDEKKAMVCLLLAPKVYWRV